MKVEPVEGARVLIESSVVDAVKGWLGNVTIAEAAQALGVSETVVKAIRAHVGISGRSD